jgi:LysM repeat protein
VADIPSTYRVQSGDTVSSIAGRFGLSTASVLAVNGLSWKSLIFPGQVLALVGRATPSVPATAAATPAPAAHAPAAEATGYAVRAGDTISGIAARFGVSTDALLGANGLGRGSVIFPGQKIAIPGVMTAAVVTARPVPVAAPATPVAPAPIVTPSSGALVALTDEMRANAAIIVQVGRQAGVGDQGLVIALAAAAQESGLRNVRHGDRDSLGLFQQRPSTGWGTPEQILDPRFAARAFFGGAGNPNAGRTRGLLDIPGWRSVTVTQAAQAVQISAFPDAYAKWEPSARAWLAQLG